MKLVRSVLMYVAWSALTWGSIAADEPPKIHECTDAKGNIVYQDEPCIDDVAVVPKAPAVAKSRAGTERPVVAKRPVVIEPWVVVKPRAVALRSTPRPDEAAPPGRPVNASWASPEKTLRTFISAVTTGDRALVLSCLTSSALADLGPDAEALPLETLRETVSSFTGYVAEGDLGPFWSIRALRVGTRPKWIFFERTGSGEWKIGAI